MHEDRRQSRLNIECEKAIQTQSKRKGGEGEKERETKSEREGGEEKQTDGSTESGKGPFNPNGKDWKECVRERERERESKIVRAR